MALVLLSALTWLRAVVAEMWNRVGIQSMLFEQQRTALRSNKRFKACICARRSGKTYLVLTDIIDDHRKHPGADYCYITLSKDSGTRIVWKLVEKLNERFQLGMTPVTSKHLWRFPNGCTLYILGADKPGWQEKFRGLGQGLRRVVIDECKSFNIDLWSFVLDAARPALVDLMGTMWVIGTPGVIPNGFWWDVTRPDEDKRSKMFELHTWDVFDNPHIAEQMAEEIADLVEAFGEEYMRSPSFLREYKGLWVVDSTNNVYDFEWERNVVTEYPREINSEGENYCLALDFGHHDAYAESLHAWSDFDDEHYILESWKRGLHRKLGDLWMGEPVMLDEVARRINGGVDPESGARVVGYKERFHGLTVVADNASPQLILELEERFGIPVYDADKTDKHGAIRVANTMLKARKIIVVVRPGEKSALAEELLTLKKYWKSKTVWVETEAQSNDCADTMLYGYRRSRHHHGSPDENSPELDSPEWFLAEARRMKQQRIAGRMRSERSYS